MVFNIFLFFYTPYIHLFILFLFPFTFLLYLLSWIMTILSPSSAAPLAPPTRIEQLQMPRNCALADLICVFPLKFPPARFFAHRLLLNIYFIIIFILSQPSFLIIILHLMYQLVFFIFY
ncbi:hypothetical protein BDV33DRAFT_163560 [Aspergillus novoparasiticus]|uniref:Uncharacterized protein n=1 Tax=Aspergillus novoparasiticus TaxID=986946 RepID=A0A5N6F6E7_9EURO|nr:hypothetical protein BDV33DRAFT_163560 [Aspergillus novoparasiticus]